jgi:SAM-dependent methyltransferase
MEMPVWLAGCDPQLPLELLVERVNEIFHSFAARRYDREHPEIYQQLPPIWAEMIAQLPGASSWNVLDVGCGTGFESDLLLSRIGNQVAKLTAYDPSTDMIALCRNRLRKFSQVSFCSRIEETYSRGPFNLLLTNSLLHHLPNIEQTVSSLLPHLSNDAVWLAGHEPSARFFRNDECLRLLDKYRRFRKYARWLVARNYTAQLRQLLRQSPLRATADVAFKRGLFRKRPSQTVIDRLVDFHVLHTSDDVSNGRGLDISRMQTWFTVDWTLHWSKSYSFLGPYPYARTPGRWVERAHLLEHRFPADGANLCMVWFRKSRGALGFTQSSESSQERPTTGQIAQ